MYSIFEIIDELRDARGLSGRKLADKAGMKPATLTSIMTRRPKTIPGEYLFAIANALGVKWTDLLNRPEEPMRESALEVKYPTELTEDDRNAILTKLLGSSTKPDPVRGWGVARMNTPQEEPIIADNLEQAMHEQYKKAIFLMLNKLNTEGLFEVIGYVSSLAKDPAYSAKSNNETQEDTE